MTDLEIIGLYFARSEAAIAETAAKYGGYCRTVADNILNDPRDAEECVNDTWLSAWNAMPPQRPRHLAPYLGRITRNLSLNRYQQYTAQKRGGGQTELALNELADCIPDPQTVERVLEGKELTAAINRFLRRQPERKRNIFIRRYWYLMSIRDIAQAYGTSQSKTASLLFRMRKELRSALEKEGIAI